MALTITDNTSYFTVSSSATMNDNYPKNSVAMKRQGDNFILANGGDAQTALIRFTYSDVSTPATADSDALEAALAAILFS